MSRFAIGVLFAPKPGARDAFLPFVKENAAQSVIREPGCHRFDVMTTDEAEEVLPYEINVDAAAFDRHVEMAHFKSFDAATRDLVAAKSVRRYAVSENAKA